MGLTERVLRKGATFMQRLAGQTCYDPPDFLEASGGQCLGYRGSYARELLLWGGGY